MSSVDFATEIRRRQRDWAVHDARIPADYFDGEHGEETWVLKRGARFARTPRSWSRPDLLED